jgi:hypothetical protein
MTISHVTLRRLVKLLSGRLSSQSQWLDSSMQKMEVEPANQSATAIYQQATPKMSIFFSYLELQFSATNTVLICHIPGVKCPNIDFACAGSCAG